MLSPRYYLLSSLSPATKDQRCISRLLWFWHLRVDFTGRLSGREPGALLLALPVSPGVFWFNASCRAAAEMLLLPPPSPLCQSEHSTDRRAAQKQNFTPPACSSASMCCACVPHLRCFCGFPVHVHISVQYVYVSLFTLPSLRLWHQRVLLSGDHAKMCQVKLQESEQKKNRLTPLNFHGCGCVLYCFQMSACISHWHINYATGRWGETLTQLKECLTDILGSTVDTEQCGLATLFTWRWSCMLRRE